MSRQHKQNTIENKNPIEGKRRTCPQCGKVFFSTAKWAYRNGKMVWCSWKCLRENENGIPPHVQPEPEPERPLTDEQMARLAEAEAHAKEISDAIPVTISKEKRDAAEARMERERRPFRSDRTELLARRSYEAIQEGAQAVKDLAEEMGWRIHYVYTRAAKYREVYGLPPLPDHERQRRCGETVQIKAGRHPGPGRSAEVTARLAAVFSRCHALLDEIRKEAGISA